MASGKRRITLYQPSRGPGFLRRLFGRAGPLHVVPDPSESPEIDSGVDFRLQHHAAIRASRSLIEGIATYQLHSRKCVHVASRYLLPPDSGLQLRIPEWIAERIRFGIVRGAGDFDYIRINSVDLAWDSEGTELFLHLDERVEPGTRAFVAAYLGQDEQPSTSAPPGVLVSKPR